MLYIYIYVYTHFFQRRCEEAGVDLSRYRMIHITRAMKVCMFNKRVEKGLLLERQPRFQLQIGGVHGGLCCPSRQAGATQPSTVQVSISKQLGYQVAPR